MKAERWLKELFALAEITPNGSRDRDPQIANPEFYRRVRWAGSLGLGESYMDGWWSAPRMDDFFYRLLSAEVVQRAGWSWPAIAGYLWSKLVNQQSRLRAREVGKTHYDLGNDLFKAMLGSRLVYSCAYWAQADNLDDAQVAKIDLVCRKLNLQPGQRVLDIGCGWGETLKYAAEHYGISRGRRDHLGGAGGIRSEALPGLAD